VGQGLPDSLSEQLRGIDNMPKNFSPVNCLSKQSANTDVIPNFSSLYEMLIGTSIVA
jgi:hypothetical protein